MLSFNENGKRIGPRVDPIFGAGRIALIVGAEASVRNHFAWPRIPLTPSSAASASSARILVRPPLRRQRCRPSRLYAEPAAPNVLANPDHILAGRRCSRLPVLGIHQYGSNGE